MSIIQVAVNDVACTSCIGKIKKGMQKYNGIEKVTIILGSGELQISFDENVIRLDDINRNLHKLTLRAFD